MRSGHAECVSQRLVAGRFRPCRARGAFCVPASSPAKRVRVGAVEHDEQVERTTHSERFRRESRLRSSQDFQRVRRKGRRQQGQWLTLTYARRLAPGAPDASADVAPLVSRIGFAVNKRVGNAVTRNRVKRRLR
ncbi:MAG TPA: ribonuclease P protein component, partial [Ktedonobacterales bacterium]